MNREPWIVDPQAHWVSTEEFAKLYDHSLRRIQQLCKSGEIMAFAIATYQDSRRRWWIRLPRVNETTK